MERKLKQKWNTVITHRSYKIQLNSYKGLGISPYAFPSGFAYRIDDPAFLPESNFYNTVSDAVQAIDKQTM